MKTSSLFVCLITSTIIYSVKANEDLRQVVDNVLISGQQPRLALRIDSPFEYVGVHEFDIRGIAGGTRHVWVDAENNRIQRMFVVQLEGFYSEADGQYHYDLSQSPEVAGYLWRSNGYSFDLSETRQEDPGNESSITATYLEEKGFELPDLILMWRSLTVVNETRTHEAILFLMESGDEHGLEISDIYRNNESTDLWKEIQIRLEDDFTKLIKLSPLDEQGEAIGSWMSIPKLNTN
ncbi:MAG: hypothetical protein GKR91_09225 [Pseudomonadales bacterium]|nr:hypothetical protein [Pseudomonadales bacterium]